LGAMGYQLLTGQLAFEGPNLTKIISRVVMEEPVPPSYVIPTLSPEVDYLVARAMAKNRDSRYATARALAEDIDDVLAGRAPRHRPGWVPAASGAVPDVPALPASPVLADEMDLELALEPLAPMAETLSPIDLHGELESLVAPPAAPPAAGDAAPTVRSPPRPLTPRSTLSSRPRPARRRVPVWLMGGVLGLALAFGLLALTVSRHRSAGAPAPPSAPAASPTGTARLAVDFEHSLKRGELRLWVDGELVLQEALDSRVTKKVLLYKKREGAVQDSLEVRPGPHSITMRVAWDGNVKSRRIAGTFPAGSTRRLRASLGGVIKKDLSLEWE
ncbi:MAG TPA: hypothetical protein VFO85_19715, partial [Vicinamibacteria bacterium]|nr:hypothetical protein [Vicinamibacteria bacterium]